MSWAMRAVRDPREGGTAAVEFALVLPLLLVIALALVQVGLLARDRLVVESAARAGARTAAVESDLASIRSAVTMSAPSLHPASVSVAVTRAGGRGEPVSVTVTYSSAVRVPFVRWLLGGGVTMTSSATDRQEFG
jgi:Flp pilus assembly protein TadG